MIYTNQVHWIIILLLLFYILFLFIVYAENQWKHATAYHTKGNYNVSMIHDYLLTNTKWYSMWNVIKFCYINITIIRDHIFFFNLNILLRYLPACKKVTIPSIKVLVFSNFKPEDSASRNGYTKCCWLLHKFIYNKCMFKDNYLMILIIVAFLHSILLKLLIDEECLF